MWCRSGQNSRGGVVRGELHETQVILGPFANGPSASFKTLARGGGLGKRSANFPAFTAQ